MKKDFSLIHFLLAAAVMGLGLYAAATVAAAEPSQQAIADQIIANEKAATVAWQHKDKAFWADHLASDATAFFAQNPYLEVDPKTNFLPKFERYAEMMKIVDTEMYNPHVQVYGDVAILTYNESTMSDMGGRVINYTGKVTSVYHKEGNTWRVVHTHGSMNPGAQ